MLREEPFQPILQVKLPRGLDEHTVAMLAADGGPCFPANSRQEKLSITYIINYLMTRYNETEKEWLMYRSLRRWLRAASIALALVTPGIAEAQVAYGVNNPTLLTSTESVWKSSLDTMAANGIRIVRTAISSKDDSTDTLVSFLKYAEHLGIKVILIFPDQNPAYYASSASFTSAGAFHKPGLAAIELPRFEAYWRAQRAAMREAGVHIYAYELGNELNGASFNLDYPTGGDALLLDLQHCDGQPGCAVVRTGWDNYVRMLHVMRSSNLLDGTLLLGGSFVRVGDGYVRQVHKSFSTVSSTRMYLAGLGADKLVDAYTFHIYPVVASIADLAKGRSEIERQMNAVYDECRSVASKPCWVTEWAFSDQGTKCEDNPRQDAFVEDAGAVFRRQAAQQGGMTAVYYAWHTGDKKAIFACGRVASPVIARMLRSNQ